VTDCSFGECARPRYARSLCNAHWQQDRDGKPLTTLLVRTPGRACDVTDCGRPHSRRGKCQTHARRAGDAIAPKNAQNAQNCGVPHCEKLAATVGMCRRHARLVSQYRLTAARIEELYANPHCGICETTDPGKRDFHIDHDHSCCPGGMAQKCGQCVRGLLCASCNHGLGNFRDDPALLEAAVRYLARGGE
jgi:hypothetical protein